MATEANPRYAHPITRLTRVGDRAGAARLFRDPAASEVRGRLEILKADPRFRDHPLMAELERLGDAHLRLLRRLGKITRISDGFQGQLKALNEVLQQASRTDALTGIPNRRAMMEDLNAELARNGRDGSGMAVLMADVDRFKAVNDTYGHEAGDRVLVALAHALRDALRAYDVCARWGGEEFLVLLPSTGRQGALEVGEKLRKAAASLFVPAGEARIAIGLSVGLAVLGQGESMDELIRKADAAMYQAKHLGGNRVEG
jgi:diguanylate cyclase (GGDEF)-like protein